MHLSIYTLNQTLFEGAVTKLTAKTTVGELTILDNHVPLLVPLMSGLLRIGGTHETETTFSIRGGFLEVKPRGDIVVLADAKS